MSYPIATGDFVQISTHCFAGNQESVNTCYYLCGGVSGGGINDSQVAQLFTALVAASYKAWMPDTASFSYGACQIVSPIRRPEQVYGGSAGVGTFGDTLTPTQTSGIIQKKTNLASRRGRGRIYPGFPSANAVGLNGQMIALAFTRLTAIAAAWPTVWIPTVGGASVTLSAFVIDAAFTGGSEVTDWNPLQLWATQRRRGEFGRHNT